MRSLMKALLRTLRAVETTLALVALLAAVSGCTQAPHVVAAPAPKAPIAPPTADQRAQALVAQMTLDEKLAYIGGDREFFIRPIERLGIPEIKMADGPVGCRNWGPSTAYPASIGLASSFDPTLAFEVGGALARDCRARGVHILLAPGANMQRSPLNGRNFEYMGEDPYLARDHIVQFIKGVQDGGVMATVKHFAANNQEWDRHHVSSEVSERALHELYFPAFEGAVIEGQVGAVMTAYNLVNGAYASHNKFLLRQTLRQGWNFRGMVMSDWSAVYDALGGVMGGTDLEMPSAVAMSPAALKKLLSEGEIKESDVDEKVFHILRTLIHFGFLDRPQLVTQPVDDPKSREVALKAAQKSIVLLKNQTLGEQPLLPLFKGAIKTIAVVGPNAHPAVHGGSGSAYTVPPHVVSLLDGIKQLLPQAEVRHHPGITESTGLGALGGQVFSGPVKQQIFNGKELKGEPIFSSEVDRINLLASGASPAPGVPAENYSIRFTGEIAVEKAGTYQVLTNADDGMRVYLDGKMVIDDFTDHAPRMKDVELNLKRGRHPVVVEYFQGTLGSICQFGFGKKVPPGRHTGEAELIRTVKDADVVVVAVGYGQNAGTNSLGSSYEAYWPPEWARKASIVEAEDDDRTFSLPSAQLATLAALAKVHKKLIVVGFSGGGVDFEPWLDKVQAVLWAWYPGQEGGTALAQTLLGLSNPQARLPVSFARKYADYPSATSYGLSLPLSEERERGPSADLSACGSATESTQFATHPRTARAEGPLYQTPYCEDIFVGYRGLDRAGTEPLFPFGYGLSYSNYNYGPLRVDITQPGDQIRASLNLVNIGTQAGSEVVQFYVAPISNGSPHALPRAPQQLAGYATVHLEPGEETKVEVWLNPRSFAVYQTEATKGWGIPEGSYEIRASRSSRHHQQHAIVSLKAHRL